MKAASLKDIKQGLALKDKEELIKLCLRTAKFKKDNKELLTYLLFESDDESTYVEQAIDEMKEQMSVVNTSSVYLAKKTVRKVLRLTQKHIKYSDHKTTQVELLIAFCKLLRSTGLSLKANTVLGNMYQRQLQVIQKAMQDLHEDLRYDYQQDVELLYR